MMNTNRLVSSLFAIVALIPGASIAFAGAKPYTEPGYIDRVLYPEGYSILSSDHVMFPVDVRDWPIEIDARRQLFVDDYLVAEVEGLTRQHHKMVKHPANPIVSSSGGRVVYDEATGTFRMWSLKVVPPQAGERTEWIGEVFYAESRDGIHWGEPKPGSLQSDGSKTNGTACIPTGRAFFRYDEGREADERYVRFIRHKPPDVDVEREGFYSYTSPDGVHWTGNLSQCILPLLTQVTMPLNGIGDTTNFRYDPVLKRYVADCKLLIPDDRLGRIRVRGMAESEDFIHWTRPRVILYVDERDEPDSQIYAQMGFVYESMWLGCVRVMHTERTGWKQTEVELSYSRDGRHWSRPSKRQPLLEFGGPDSWEPDYSGIHNQTPLLVGDRLWFYYMGSRNPERDKAPVSGDWKIRTGVATLRRDGFASLNGSTEPGSVVTRPLTFKGESLFINAEVADGGYIKAAVLSRTSEPLAGYSLEDSVPMTGDTTKGAMSWRNAKNIKPSGTLTDHYRLEFEIKNAKLYSFWIE